MTNAQRRRYLLAAAGLLATLPVIPMARAEDKPRRTIDVRIEGRKVVRHGKAIRIDEDEAVNLRWTSDEEVRLHLHGYDIKTRVRPGQPAVMEIDGYATGRFPINSHGWGKGGHAHEALIFLEVHPR